jgi:hypothetical protein
MSRKELFVRFITTFGVTFVVTVMVTFLWSLIRHGAGVIDWETSFRMAFILGVALPVSGALLKREKQN